MAISLRSLPARLQDLGLELRAVFTELGPLNHSIHRGHDACSLSVNQDAFTARLPQMTKSREKFALWALLEACTHDFFTSEFDGLLIDDIRSDRLEIFMAHLHSYGCGDRVG